jgi:hypothetical protein
MCQGVLGGSVTGEVFLKGETRKSWTDSGEISRISALQAAEKPVLYQGTTLHAAEKLGFRVGRGFIPGVNGM